MTFLVNPLGFGLPSQPPSAISNLTFWFDATTATLYQTEYNGAAPTAATANNDPIGFVIVDGNDGTNRCLSDVITTTIRPLLKTAAVNGNNYAEFDGSNDKWALFSRTMSAPQSGFGSTGTGTSVSTGMGASNWTYCAALRVRATTLASTLPTYQQHTLFADNGQFVGLYAGNVNTTDFKFGAYVWDGADKKAQITATKNTWYVVGVKFDGTTISIRLNGGSYTTSLSGSIQTTTNFLGLGQNSGAASSMDLCEFALWKALLSDADLLTVERYFGAKIGVTI